MAKPCGIITLLSDFGTEDPFVGIMKGVILSRFPGARVVDLTHGVPPQNVVAGAFWLERSYPWFPPGSVHVPVVDPGVGTSRASVAVRVHGHYFVAPDNGIVAAIAASDPNAEVRRLTPTELGLPVPSATFHGRDVFAPIAADLASGQVPFARLGELASLAVPPLREKGDEEAKRGRVVVVDHFGNLITDVEARQVVALDSAEVQIGDVVVPVLPLGESYGSVGVGQLTALVNAHGTLEVAERDGNAAVRLGVGPGAEVRIRKGRP